MLRLADPSHHFMDKLISLFTSCNDLSRKVVGVLGYGLCKIPCARRGNMSLGLPFSFLTLRDSIISLLNRVTFIGVYQSKYLSIKQVGRHWPALRDTDN